MPNQIIELPEGSVRVMDFYKLTPARRSERFIEMARGADGEAHLLRAIVLAGVSGVNEDGEVSKLFDVGLITARLDIVEAHSAFPIKKPF